MPSLRLLHISDLHLAAPPYRWWDKPHHDESLRELARMIKAWWADGDPLTRDIDGLLISGDLVDSARRANLELARVFVTGRASAARPSSTLPLLPENLPTAIVPGNHDRFHHRTRLPGDQTFDEIFAPSGHWPGGQRIGSAVFSAKDGDKTGVVMADFTLHSAREELHEASRLKDVRGLWGKGRVPDTAKTALRNATASLHRKLPAGSPVIWMIHFAPDLPLLRNQTGMAFADLDLIGGEKVIAAAAECGVQHIIYGHTHHQHRLTHPAGISLHGAGAATKAAAAESGDHHSLQVLRVDFGSGNPLRILRTEYHWDESGDYREFKRIA